MSALGASRDFWHDLVEAGLAADLLPVVCDLTVPISPASKLSELGKVPSAIDGRGMAHGVKDWTSKVTTADEIEAWSSDDRLGICLQTRLCKVFDVDIEDKALADQVEGLLRPLIADLAGVSLDRVPLRFRKNSSKFALIVRCDAVLPKRVIGLDGTNKIEFLGNGQQAMISGTHPSGSRIKWEVSPTEAPTLTADQIDTIWSRLEEELGAEQSSVSAFDDVFAGHEPRLGLSVPQIERILSHISPDIGRDEWLHVGLAIHHEAQGDDTGLAIWDEWSSDGATYRGTEDVEYQWNSFRGPTPGRRSITMATVIWMAKKGGYVHSLPAEATNEADGRQGNEWSPPLPLPDVLLPVPLMTADMLPKELQPWLTDIADRMSVPLDFVAIPAMVMLGALIGRKVSVRPEEFTNWTEPANLWGAIVSPPGAMKTPVVAQVLAPIKKFEAAAQQENRAKLAQYELDLLINSTAKKAALSGSNRGKDGPWSEADIEQALMNCAAEPPKPKLKRFMTTDATVEKLGEICADNPNGILYHRDELPSLFADLQREEKAPVRGFMLTGWTGLESYTFDRIARGTTHIEAVNISLFGTAQPQRVAHLVAASTAKHDDGMIQRLQLLAWPDLAGDWVSADRPPDAAARDAAIACCQRLSELQSGAVGAEWDDPEDLPFLRLRDEARDAFEGYRVPLEAKLRSGSLPEHLGAHLSKFRGLVPRLALILHLAGGGAGRVALEPMCVAIQWAHYLEAHARRMYASVDMATSDTARLLLRRIRNGELREGFSQRDITQKGWSGLRDADQVERALKTLEEYGWLRSNKVQTGGRGKEVFQIHPAAMA